MKIRNYCIIIMGDTIGSDVEIAQLSQSRPNILNAKGILIATFVSSLTPNELEIKFKSYGRSFVVFELDKETSGFHINKPNIHEGLFGFIGKLGDDALRNRLNALYKEINLTSDTKNEQTVFKNNTKLKRVKTIKEKEFTEAEVDKMGPSDKTVLLNKLIDKGPENLTEYDKKILQRLVI